jgi:hypothetical protein
LGGSVRRRILRRRTSVGHPWPTDHTQQALRSAAHLTGEVKSKATAKKKQKIKTTITNRKSEAEQTKMVKALRTALALQLTYLPVEQPSAAQI